MTPEQIELINRWSLALEEATKVAKPLIAAEQALRKEVIASLFPTPKEGTNHLELAQGWKLTLGYKVDRKIDEAALPAIRLALSDMGISADTLVKMVPALELKAYKGLREVNEDAAKVFEQALTIKPGSHTLELVPPKEPKQ